MGWGTTFYTSLYFSRETFRTKYEVESALGAMVTPNIAFVVELILTFVFVLTVLSVTKKENCNSGVVIGLTLTLVHIFGFPRSAR